ncbi:hypothetical protein PAMP_019353 [Pampus punctatissimus]
MRMQSVNIEERQAVVVTECGECCYGNGPKFRPWQTQEERMTAPQTSEDTGDMAVGYDSMPVEKPDPALSGVTGLQDLSEPHPTCQLHSTTCLLCHEQKPSPLDTQGLVWSMWIERRDGNRRSVAA